MTSTPRFAGGGNVGGWRFGGPNESIAASGGFGDEHLRTTDLDTFVCVGSRSWLGAGLRITLHFDDGTSSTRDIVVGDRYTLWPRFDFPESVGRGLP